MSHNSVGKTAVLGAFKMEIPVKSSQNFRTVVPRPVLNRANKSGFMQTLLDALDGAVQRGRMETSLKL